MSFSNPKSIYLFLFLLFAFLAVAILFGTDQKKVSVLSLNSSFAQIPADVNESNEEEIIPTESEIIPIPSSEEEGAPIPLEPGAGGDQTLSPTWGNDVLIAPGTVSGGISATHDFNDNMYAVRCTTWEGTTNRMVRIYKSTDDGVSWSYFRGFYSVAAYSYSLPVVLVGNDGDSSFVYVFYLYSYQNGNVQMVRWRLDGSGYMYKNVEAGTDTISYISATCSPDGESLVVAYVKEEPGDATPDLHTIRSTNYGKTWSGDVFVDGDNAQPDIEYIADGRVLLVSQDYDTNKEIQIHRSTNFGSSWSSVTFLTSDDVDDSYPKIAAIHQSPATSATVWATYNHHTSSTNIDLRYAYSTDGGATWTKNLVLAGSSTYDEMASDLFTYRFYTWTNAYVCYLKYDVGIWPWEITSDIISAWVSTSDPDNWQEKTRISEHYGAYSQDGREVCQGTFYIKIVWILPVPYGGVVYAGKPSRLFNFEDLYFDGYTFVDVEEGEEEKATRSEFSLFDNYPNPFNPETRISYFLPKACQVKLEIYNILGQRIRTLVDEDQSAGKKEIIWDGKNESGEQVASGVYFYNLQAGNFVQTKKMVLIR